MSGMSKSLFRRWLFSYNRTLTDEELKKIGREQDG